MKPAFYSDLCHKFYLTKEECKKAEEKYNKENEKKLKYEEEKKKAAEDLKLAKEKLDAAKDVVEKLRTDYNNKRYAYYQKYIVTSAQTISNTSTIDDLLRYFGF